MTSPLSRRLRSAVMWRLKVWRDDHGGWSARYFRRTGPHTTQQHRLVGGSFIDLLVFIVSPRRCALRFQRRESITAAVERDGGGA